MSWVFCKRSSSSSSSSGRILGGRMSLGSCNQVVFSVMQSLDPGMSRPVGSACCCRAGLGDRVTFGFGSRVLRPVGRPCKRFQRTCGTSLLC